MLTYNKTVLRFTLACMLAGMLMGVGRVHGQGRYPLEVQVQQKASVAVTYGTVFYRQATKALRFLSTNDGSVIAERGDDVGVHDSGEALLTFADFLRIRVFKHTTSTLQFEPIESNIIYQLTLKLGTIFVDRSAPKTADEVAASRLTELRIVSDNVVLRAVGTQFFVNRTVHAETGEPVTWVVVTEGSVIASTSASDVVTISAGQQSWTRDGRFMAPVAALRSVIDDPDSTMRETLLPIEALTDGSLHDDTILFAGYPYPSVLSASASAASSITDCYPSYEINATVSGIGPARVTYAWQSNDGLLQQQGVLTFSGNVPPPVETGTLTVEPSETPIPKVSPTPQIDVFQIKPRRRLSVRSQIRYQSFAQAIETKSTSFTLPIRRATRNGWVRLVILSIETQNPDSMIGERPLAREVAPGFILVSNPVHYSARHTRQCPAPPPPFRARASAGCPVAVSMSGVISVNRGGTVLYRWIINGRPGPVRRLRFLRAGSQRVTASISTQPRGATRAQLRVLSPGAVASRTTVVTCQ